MVNTVVYPTFAHYRSDPERVGRSFLQTVRFTYFCLMIPLIALAAAPGSFLRFYGGGQWAAAAGVLFYLVLMQMALALGANVFPTFMALGKPQVGWQWNLFITVVQSSVVLATARFGILAVSKGLAVSALVMLLAVLWLSKAAQFRYLDYVRNMAFLVGFLPVALFSGNRLEHLLSRYPAIFRFAVSSVGATILYIVLVLAIDSQARHVFLKASQVLRRRLSPAT
jgi:O-antigen/teichoic acid export membrane protein